MKPNRGLFLTFLSGFSLGASACAARHTVEVPVSAVPQLARDYREGGSVTIIDHGSAVRVNPAQEPLLELTGDCWVASDCTTSAPLSEVQGLRDGSYLLFDEIVDPDDVERANISLRGYVPRGWRPRWAFGLAVGGVAWVGGPQLQFLPHRLVALEAGAFGGTEGFFIAWAGLRLRGWQVWGIRPFVGLGANRAAGAETGAAVRAGLELELAARRWLLVVELDGVRGSQGHVWDSSGQPYGGFSVSYAW